MKNKKQYLLLSALVSLLSFVIAERTLSSQFSSGCGGLEFGCAINAGLLAIAISLIVSIILSGVILRKSYATTPWSSIVFTSILSITFTFVATGFLTSYATHFAIALTIFLYISSFFINFRILLKIPKLNLRLVFVIGSLSIYAFILYPLAAKSVDDAYFSDIQAAAENATFTFYEPTKYPKGYTISDSHYDWAPYDSWKNPHYEILFSLDNKPILTMYQFETPDEYDPPDNCTDYKPDYQEFFTKQVVECEEIGSSDIGCTVYKASPKSSTYCRVNNTLITFRYSTFLSGARSLSDSELIGLYDSSTPSDYESLQELQAEYPKL